MVDLIQGLITQATNLGCKNWLEKYKIIKNNFPDPRIKCNKHMKLDFILNDDYKDKSKKVLSKNKTRFIKN